jgi:hypothetical protein
MGEIGTGHGRLEQFGSSRPIVAQGRLTGAAYPFYRDRGRNSTALGDDLKGRISPVFYLAAITIAFVAP